MPEQQKNETRLSSLMGTWTWHAHLKVATYDIQAALVMYITPDPLRQVTHCELDNNCQESRGQFCQLTPPDFHPQCHNMTDTVATWSDALVYYSIRFAVNGDFPVKEHDILGTAGWVGPFNVLWAPQPTDSSSSLSDRYTLRYVETAAAPLLQRHLEKDNLFPLEGQFYNASFGIPALQATIRRQAQLKHKDDPFEGQVKNCQQGTIQPLLPLLSFQFNLNNNTTQNTTSIDWQVDYRLMLALDDHQPLQRFLPFLAREMNNLQLGVTAQGPYCWEGDPRRVWMLASSMDSFSKLGPVQLTQGCVEGLPCRPGEILPTTRHTPHMVPDHCPAIVYHTPLWKFSTYLLLLLWVGTVLVCCYQGCGREKQPSEGAQESQQSSNGDSNATSSDEDGEALPEGQPQDADLEQPLLSTTLNTDCTSHLIMKMDTPSRQIRNHAFGLLEQVISPIPGNAGQYVENGDAAESNQQGDHRIL